MMLDHGILLVVLHELKNPFYFLTSHTVACLIHMFIYLQAMTVNNDYDHENQVHCHKQGKLFCINSSHELLLL